MVRIVFRIGCRRQRMVHNLVDHHVLRRKRVCLARSQRKCIPVFLPVRIPAERYIVLLALESHPVRNPPLPHRRQVRQKDFLTRLVDPESGRHWIMKIAGLVKSNETVTGNLR